MMNKCIRFALIFAIALLLVFIVRRWMFTLYLVTVEKGSKTTQNTELVMVNKLPLGPIQRGDKVLMHCKNRYIGQIVALPGDTITIEKQLFVVPVRPQCPCSCCVNGGYIVVKCNGKMHVVCRQDIEGRVKHLLFLNL